MGSRRSSIQSFITDLKSDESYIKTISDVSFPKSKHPGVRFIVKGLINFGLYRESLKDPETRDWQIQIRYFKQQTRAIRKYAQKLGLSFFARPGRPYRIRGKNHQQTILQFTGNYSKTKKILDLLYKNGHPIFFEKILMNSKSPGILTTTAHVTFRVKG